MVEDDGGDFDRVRRLTIGFSAVPALIAGRVDAVVSFWNVEGVALRERGVATREFRVDEFGAPRYPELVLAVERDTLEERRALVDDVLAALRAGTRAALADRPAAVADIVQASGADEPLIRGAARRRRAGPEAAARARPRGARRVGRVRRPLRHPRRAAGRGARVLAASFKLK